MVRFFVDAALDLAGTLKMLPSSLLSFSICSLIAVARFSWLTERSSKFMGLVNIQSWRKSSADLRLVSGNDDSTDVTAKPTEFNSWRTQFIFSPLLTKAH